MNDIVRGKIRNIRDCVERIRAVDPGDVDTLTRDLVRQESILLNVQRACQAAIDLAVQVLHARGLEPPTDARDAFTRLQRAGVITPGLADRLRKVVGFRNIAVHRYHELDMEIVRAVIDHRLGDLLALALAVEQPPA